MEQTQEQQQMQMLMTQLQDDNLRQSVMQYIKQTADGMDIGADSKILIQTLARESVNNQKHAVVWKSRTKKSVVVGVLSVVLAIGVQFFVNYFTNELSKESHVDEQGAMLSTDGKVVKTQLDEMMVGSDGRLVSRGKGDSVKTMPTLARVVLASSLPDDTLMGLEEIVVFSDTGYTLQFKVHGFSRMPVLNSRCGNVVHFYTAWKGKITLDSTDLSFDETTAAEFEKAGFNLAKGGRRLAAGSAVDGFFKAVEKMKASGKWTCAGVPLPAVPEMQQFTSTRFGPCSKHLCDSRYGQDIPGVGKMSFGLTASNKAYGDRYWETTTMRMQSARYTVHMETMQQHPGQQYVTFLDSHTNRTQFFQLFKNKKYWCRPELEKKMDTKASPDVFFEYVGIEEEEGEMFRHFRMKRNHEFLVEMSGSEIRNEVTEFWDQADTMQARHVLEPDGTVVTFSSMTAVSDADIEHKLAGLMDDCNSQDRGQDVPEMRVIHDLDEKEVNFYMGHTFEGSESVLHDAANKKNEFAMYSKRAQDPYSMPDRCRVACQSQLRAFEEDFKNGAKPTCVEDDLKKTFDCLDKVDTGNGKSCQFHNWEMSFRHICGGEGDGEDVFANTTNTPNTTARVLDDDSDDDRGDDSHNLLEEPLLVSNNSETAGQRRLSGKIDRNLWGSANAPSCLSTFLVPVPVAMWTMVNWWLPDMPFPGGGKLKEYMPDQWKQVQTWWSAGNRWTAEKHNAEKFGKWEADMKKDPESWTCENQKECDATDYGNIRWKNIRNVYNWETHDGKIGGNSIGGVFRKENDESVFALISRAKAECIEHNNRNYEEANLCKFVVCWSHKTRTQQPDESKTQWDCIMKNSADMQQAGTWGQQRRIRSYTNQCYKNCRLKGDVWKGFRLGSDTTPWCVSFKAKGNKLKDFVNWRNWDKPWTKGGEVLDGVKEFFFLVFAEKEEKKHLRKEWANGKTKGDREKYTPQGRKAVISRPLPPTRQDKPSKGSGDANNGCRSEKFCMHPVTKGAIAQCAWCYIKQFAEWMKKFLTPLKNLILKGWKAVKNVLATLSHEHIMTEVNKKDQGKAFQFTVLWGKTKNPFTPSQAKRFYIQIELKACIDMGVPFPVIKPPVESEMCIAGTLRLISGASCPGIIIIFVGKATLTVSVSINFWFAVFEIAAVQIGVEMGTDRHTPSWCWWYYNPRWGWGLSWWQIRRRRVHKCAWGSEVCSVYVKGWISIKIWICKVILEVIWWMSSGTIDLWLRFKVETIWSLYWEWKEIWGSKVWTNR